jgi:hypothetical protein
VISVYFGDHCPILGGFSFFGRIAAVGSAVCESMREANDEYRIARSYYSSTMEEQGYE